MNDILSRFDTPIFLGPTHLRDFTQTDSPSEGGGGENGEIVEDTIPSINESSPNSTNSPGPPLHKAIYPEDSILKDWMDFASQFSESADCHLIDSILPIVGGMLGRRIWFSLAGKKYPNVYVILCARAGHRKSTIIHLAEKLGKQILDRNRFSSSCASEEALFEQYDPDQKGGYPDKIMVCEEGNTLMANWKESSYGKIVAKRYLLLYDCRDWKQAFKQNKNSSDGCVERYIPETSTSILIGAPFHISRFQGLEIRDGMRRRVLPYVAEKMERTIYFPREIEGSDFNALVARFKPLIGDLPLGKYSFSDSASDLWCSIQDNNRERGNNLPINMDSQTEALASILSEEPSHTLKIAMIFEACRWVYDQSREPLLIQEDTLNIASQHVKQCIQASQILETIGNRAEIRNEADSIHAQIQKQYMYITDKIQGGFINLTKSELTSRFAPHTGRRGAMTPDRLYNVIFPDLIYRGRAKGPLQEGKKVLYAFKIED